MTIVEYLIQSLAWVVLALMLGGALGGIGVLVRERSDHKDR